MYATWILVLNALRNAGNFQYLEGLIYQPCFCTCGKCELGIDECYSPKTFSFTLDVISYVYISRSLNRLPIFLYSIRVWDCQTSVVVRLLSVAHSQQVTGIAAHPSDDQLFLSSGMDGNVLLWDLRCPKPASCKYNINRCIINSWHIFFFQQYVGLEMRRNEVRESVVSINLGRKEFEKKL